MRARSAGNPVELRRGALERRSRLLKNGVVKERRGSSAGRHLQDRRCGAADGQSYPLIGERAAGRGLNDSASSSCRRPRVTKERATTERDRIVQAMFPARRSFCWGAGRKRAALRPAPRPDQGTRRNTVRRHLQRRPQRTWPVEFRRALGAGHWRVSRGTRVDGLHGYTATRPYTATRLHGYTATRRGGLQPRPCRGRPKPAPSHLTAWTRASCPSPVPEYGIRLAPQRPCSPPKPTSNSEKLGEIVARQETRASRGTQFLPPGIARGLEGN